MPILLNCGNNRSWVFLHPLKREADVFTDSKQRPHSRKDTPCTRAEPSLVLKGFSMRLKRADRSCRRRPGWLSGSADAHHRASEDAAFRTAS